MGVNCIMQGTGWDLIIKVTYIIVTFIVYTSGDMRSNPHNARKLSFSLSVVNKNLEIRSQG